MPTADRVAAMEDIDQQVQALGSSWQALAISLAAAVIQYRQGKDYWAGYLIESMARNIIAKEKENASD
jgi:hypothetical protein